MKNIYMQNQVYVNLHVYSTTAYLRNRLHRITVFSYYGYFSDSFTITVKCYGNLNNPQD